MAAVEAEAVGQFVLGERAEVAEPHQYREVREPQVVLLERLDQRPVSDPGDMAREIGGECEERGRAQGVKSASSDFSDSSGFTAMP
uniref:Uncharacterized protein n=1 Tax=Streptomyces avermitilis TaxID=33903 RepID=A0A499VZC6_STRAX|nr:hypothetical protein SAVMC3_64480 [Streptomyces avermitilis]